MRNPSIAIVLVPALLLGSCASDPTTSEQYLALEQELSSARAVIAEMEQQLADATSERDGMTSRLDGQVRGESIAEMVMNAWAGGDQADIRAVYAEDVRMVVDADTLASNRQELTELIRGVIDFGNTYRQVGPVAEYLASGGDTFIATLVEVVGPGHPTGVPIVGFYRVRDGEVIRHVFIDADDY